MSQHYEAVSSTETIADAEPQPFIQFADPASLELNFLEETTDNSKPPESENKTIKEQQIRAENVSSRTFPPFPPLPPLESPIYSSFRYQIFIVYRRLFSVVYMANLVALIVVLRRNRSLTDTLHACAANLAVAGLARSPHVTNAVFVCVAYVPRTVPLRLRHYLARFAHYGGLHSGAGVAALTWYIALVGLASRDYVTGKEDHIISASILTLLYLVLFLLLLMVIVAYPVLRFKMHDTFELVHRYSAWATVTLFWALLLTLANELRRLEQRSLGAVLSNFPTFWFAVLLTVLLVIPWVTLRRVPVRSEYLSNHAVRLHFDYTTIGLGQGISVATSPWKDWHSFVVFPDRDDPTFSIVVSKVGDWTTACIKCQPSHLWKRAIPITGFAVTTALFNRILVVCTGSGIGPALSLLAAKDLPACRMLWQTRNPQRTYGLDIVDKVFSLDPAATIIDTDREGRQDMVALAWRVAHEHNAEAVFVISNPKTTKEITFGLEARGVPAYGPLWDS